MPRTVLKRKIDSLLRQAIAMASTSRELAPALDAPTDPSRRRFVQGSLVAAGALALPAVAAPMVREALGQAYARVAPRIVIIGGGLAGLTAAYRLTQAGVRSQLIEANRDFGGRVRTARGINDDQMFCELGGELVDSGHDELMTLARELGVGLQDLRPADHGLHTETFHAGGRLRTEGEVRAAMKPLARSIAQDLEAIGVDGAITYANHSPAAVAFDQQSLRDYLRAKRPIAPPWLLDLIEHAYVSEYGLDAHEQSSLNLLTLLDLDISDGFAMYGESDEAWRIRGGSSRLAEALVKAVSGHCDLRVNTRLTGIGRVGGPESRATGLALKVRDSHGSRTVEADYVICTLPFSVLRDVDGISSLGLDARQLRCIRELGYGVNQKVMLGYQTRAWRNQRQSNGSSLSDTAIQSTWDSSRGQSGSRGILTLFAGGSPAHALSQASSAQLAQSVDTVFAQTSSARGSERISLDWSASPLSRGSYACPRVGQHTTLLGLASLPALSGHLHFAGEHASLGSQGYMNGAVETGDRAARRVLAQVKPLKFRRAPNSRSARHSTLTGETRT